MRAGLPGVLQHVNHALHLLYGAMWLGGLLPVLFCMQLTREGSHPAAIGAMMRFSRYGHVAVAGVILRTYRFTSAIATISATSAHLSNSMRPQALCHGHASP